MVQRTAPADLSRAPVLNREAWLTNALAPLSELIASRTALSPASKVVVSVGWPGGSSIRKTIGQCWPTKVGDGLAHVFISPVLTGAVDVLATLLHELIHAADDCEHGHKGPFVAAMRAVGMAGKPTVSVPGPDLAAELAVIAKELGAYPHEHGITPGARVTKVQGTRMLKAYCNWCGYTVRVTRKWLDIAVPECPTGNCEGYGQSMEIEAK